MPANRTSLRLTEEYRDRMIALREGGELEAERVWREVDQRNLDATYQVKTLATTVAALQREGVRLSAGYLHAFIESELGERVDAPVVDRSMVGKSRKGHSLQKALQNPMAEVKGRIGDGEVPDVALAYGLTSLTRMVGLAIDTATRDSLQSGIQNAPQTDGWVRVIGGTCGACIAAATGYQPQNRPMGVHPYCRCIGEPNVKYVGRTYARHTGDEIWASMTKAEQDAAVGDVEIADAIRKGELSIDELLGYTEEGSDIFISQASKRALGLYGVPVKEMLIVDAVAAEEFIDWLEPVERAIELVNEVHRYPEGSYRNLVTWSPGDPAEPELRGFRDKKARKIWLNLINDDPEMPGYGPNAYVDPESVISVLIHELGHQADELFDPTNVYGASQLALNEALNKKWPERFPTMLDEDGDILPDVQEVLKQQMEAAGYEWTRNAEPPHPVLIELFEAILDSDTVKRIMSAFEPGSNASAYLLDPEELFARAYMQWILTDRGISVSMETAGPVPIQWSYMDFKPIQDAFERLFRELGLLRPRRRQKP